jgi:UDP-N-acetylglucosamine--N-acetylmuramyl-(pentapeptide) pyrophosphoryl-undecaprenol N-acetylglucosamine transferase
MDRSIIQGAGLPFHGIHAGRLRRYFTMKTIADTFRVGAGFLEALTILRRERPALLFSKGGFVSVPPVMAASALGIPVFTHESDFSPGLATKLNSRFASKVFVAYKETAAFFPPQARGKVIHTGNPVRAAFRTASPAKGRAFLGLPDASSSDSPAILLVLGGSQGAKQVNDIVWGALEQLTRHYIVVHQTGAGANAYSGVNPYPGLYIPLGYIDEEMPHVLAAATLVLGRSGAGTVWESAVCGKPMALIPLNGSGSRGDQIENARFFTDAGAAVTFDNPSAQEVASVLSKLACDSSKLAAMSAASASIGKIDGAAIIADAIKEALHDRA